jgi:DeoR/GlpR family transcriptional regulator of sugar metabolism
MLQAERRKYILSLIEEKGSVIIEDLAKELKVSPMTIRRDLIYLEKNNFIVRTHGGAVPFNNLHQEVPYQNKVQSEIEEKKRIAEYASSLIKEGQTVILDAGTTTMEIAKKIMNLKDIVVVTTDLLAALYLSKSKNIQVYCTGGFIQNEIGTCIGTEAEKFLTGICADIAFIGASAVDLKSGVTSPTMEKAIIKKRMIEAADYTVLVADHTKFGKKNFAKICALEELDLIITDNQIDEILLKNIIRKEISIHVV